MNDFVLTRYRKLLTFVNKGHVRSIKAKKNILAAILLKGGSIAISFLLVPLTINYVNATQYGVWLTLSSIVAWFGFFDIGFGNGLRNKFAESQARGDVEQVRIYVSTTYAILTIIIGAVLIIFLGINPFLDWSKILNTPPEMAAELSGLALIVFAFFCLQFVLQLISTIVTANQQPAMASLFNLLGSLLSLIVIYVLTVTTSGNLLYLGISLGAAPVLVLTAASFWLFANDYKKYAPAIRFVKWHSARDLMSLGIKFFVLQIAFVVLYQSSNIIITQLFGPLQVTPYNIAFKYFSLIPMLLGIITVPFWSAFTEAWVKKDLEWIKNTMRTLRLLWGGLSILTLFMLAFANYIYRIWVGEDIEVPFLLSAVMALYVIVTTWNTMYSQFLNGVGKITLQLYSGIWGMILNIPLAIYLGKLLGLPGVILSTVLLALINMVWEPIQTNKLLNNTARGIWDK